MSLSALTASAWKTSTDDALWPSATFARPRAKVAVILGPVTPAWTGAAFCTPLVDLLLDHGYRVEVLDSLYPLLDRAEGQEPERREQSLAVLAERLHARFPTIHLLAGYALGGTLAMALAPRFAATGSVLSLSGPGFADDALRAALEPIIARLASMDLAGGLDLLSQAVAPAGSRPAPTHRDLYDGQDDKAAIARMTRGFRTLLDLDVRPLLPAYSGRLLALTGAGSRLATADNLGFLPDGPRRVHAEIPGSGMRILLDNPDASLGIIKEWLTNDTEDPGSPR